MKKLLFIIALFTFNLAQSQNLYKITGASFDTSFSVLSGSEQWIDVKCDTPYPDYFPVYCVSTVSLDSQATSNLLIYEPSVYFDNLPFNLDSSKRVYFNVPWSIPSGYFAIITNLISNGVAFGKVTYATDIKELSQTVPQKKYTYTNLLGQSTTQLKGLLIRSDKRLVYFE